MTGKPSRHYVLSAAGRKGPYSPAELRQLAADGFVPPETPTEPEAGGPTSPLSAVIERAGEVPATAPANPFGRHYAPRPPKLGRGTRRRRLTVAGVLCLAAAVGIGYEWLRPLTARETARRVLDARTVGEALPYCTSRMTGFLGEVFKTPNGPDDAVDEVELFEERDAPGVPDGRAVDFKGRLRDEESGRVVSVTGFVLLLKGDRWRMDDLLVSAYDGRETGEPLSIVAAWEARLREREAAAPAKPLVLPKAMKPAKPAPADPWINPAWANRQSWVPSAFDWGRRRFGLAGGIVFGGVALLLMAASYYSANQPKKRN